MYLALLALPLLSAVSTGLFGRKVGVSGTHLISCTLLVVSALLSVLAFYEVGLNGSSLSLNLGS